jgi:predicted PurR-regulated permease PerM
MPVILLGALGGIASGGILGMFVGATVLALGYEIFKGWVATNPEYDSVSNDEQIKHGDSGPKTQNHL